MKKIWSPKLSEILPESLLLDDKMKAAAQALDVELEKLSASIMEVLHLPRLDELSGAVIDFLAEAFHIDFWEPLYLTEAEKKNLIRESIAWHRIKGTLAAVEDIAKWAWREAEIIEPRDDPELLPYRFRITTKGFKETPDGLATFRRMIYAAKNVRSWLDKIIIDYSHLMTPINLHVGFSEVKVGRQVIGLGRPTGGKLDLVAGVGVGQFGTRTIKLAVPEIWFGNENRLNAGQVLVRSGTVTIGADLDDLYKLPEIRECAIADLLIADVGIARPMGVLDVRENNSGYIGHVLIRQGTITIQADMSDLNGEPWIRECAAADLLIADVGIARPNKIGDAEPEIPDDDEEAVPEGLWLRNYFDFPTGRDHPVLLANPREDLTVGDVKAVGEYASANHILMNARAEGTLGIRKASLIHGYNLVTADESQKLPTTGKVRLYFDFPSGQHRRILLQERRADMLVGDLKTFGEFTTTNKILMNARGEPSTGLTHASVIREFAVKALPADTPIKF